jgi:hypothetical protein
VRLRSSARASLRLILLSSVGFKRGEQVYLLETDVSFRATPECWSLPGLLSCVFVGEDFMPVNRAPDTPPPAQQQHQPPPQQQQHYHQPPPQHQQHYHPPAQLPQQYNLHHAQPPVHQHKQHDGALRQQQFTAAAVSSPYTGRALSVEEVCSRA